jgi:preprotein translocase subunit SecG
MESLLTPILLAIHIMLAAALIAVVLLQKSEGGLGGLGGGGMSGFMTSRGSANLLTKTTRWLAAAFMVTSLLLAWLASQSHTAPAIVLPSAPAPEAPSAPPEPVGAPAPAVPSTGSATPATPAPSAPTVPTSQ